MFLGAGYYKDRNCLENSVRPKLFVTNSPLIGGQNNPQSSRPYFYVSPEQSSPSTSGGTGTTNSGSNPCVDPIYYEIQSPENQLLEKPKCDRRSTGSSKYGNQANSCSNELYFVSAPGNASTPGDDRVQYVKGNSPNGQDEFEMQGGMVPGTGAGGSIIWPATVSRG